MPTRSLSPHLRPFGPRTPIPRWKLSTPRVTKLIIQVSEGQDHKCCRPIAELSAIHCTSCFLRGLQGRSQWGRGSGGTDFFFLWGASRGPLVFEVGYHPRKKIHVIRVVFQDLAMYARTSFRGAKTWKIGKKKGWVFGHIDKFWKGHDGQIKKKNAKKYLGSIFIPEKYVFRVCFESLLRGWYPAWNASGPRGQNTILRGQISKHLPKMADFGHFFLLTGGGASGGRASYWVQIWAPNTPLMPPLGRGRADCPRTSIKSGKGTKYREGKEGGKERKRRGKKEREGRRKGRKRERRKKEKGRKKREEEREITNLKNYWLWLTDRKKKIWGSLRGSLRIKRKCFCCCCCCFFFLQQVHKILQLSLRGYCTPRLFFNCLCIFLKTYNTLVTSKICFL